MAGHIGTLACAPVELARIAETLSPSQIVGETKVEIPGRGFDLKSLTGGQDVLAYEKLGPIHLFDPKTHADTAVKINVEGDFDLRHASGGRPNSLEPEVTERAVVTCKLPFALQHMNVHGGLVVVSRREHF